MAEQYIITQLSFLQAWYHLFWLWVLSPTYMSKFSSATLSNCFLGNQHTACTECRDAEQIDSGCG